MENQGPRSQAVPSPLYSLSPYRALTCKQPGAAAEFLMDKPWTVQDKEVHFSSSCSQALSSRCKVSCPL